MSITAESRPSRTSRSDPVTSPCTHTGRCAVGALTAAAHVAAAPATSTRPSSRSSTSRIYASHAATGPPRSCECAPAAGAPAVSQACSARRNAARSRANAATSLTDAGPAGSPSIPR